MINCVRAMAATGITTGKLVAGIVIAILVSSIVSIVVSTQLIPGREGPQGERGPAGATGATGAAGATGATGATGPAGATGATGAAGTAGAAGAAGAVGATGPQGPKGERGFGFEQQGNISIGYSAFVPENYNDNASYDYVYGLLNYNTGSPLNCYASLQLPQGATITNATFYFYDNNDNGDFLFDLLRGNTTDTWREIDFVWKISGEGTPGYNHISLDDINPDLATVDNNNYHYYLYIEIPRSSISVLYYRFYYALVEYEFPA